MHPVVAPSVADPVVRAASEVVGGPRGRRAVDDGAWRWAWRLSVLVVVGTTALALALRQHCRGTFWASPDQFTHACYSDIPALYLTHGLDRGVAPYLEAVSGAHLAQPVGTGGLLWLLSLVAPAAGPPGEQARWAFDIAVVAVAVAAVVLVLSVLALSGRRPWDAAMVALSPVLATASLVSLDLLAVAAVTAGMWAFARDHPVLAGALIGTAVTIRPFASVVALALVLLALRTGRWGAVVRTVLATGAVVLAVNLPVLVASPEGWAAYPRAVLDAPVSYGSLWLLPRLAGFAVPAGAGLWISGLGVVAVVVGVGLFTLGARRRPRLPVVVLLLVVGLMAVGVSVPVQTSLWVLPFAVLAVPRWRDLLVWGAVEACYATGTWLYLYAQSVPDRGLPPWAYALLVVARVAALGWLASRAVRLSRMVWSDPVRSPPDAPDLGRDDPAAGPLEDAPDALLVRFG